MADPGVDTTPTSLLDLIAARAVRDPAALALLAPDRPPLSFEGLLRQVDRIVQALAGAGLGRGSRIALAMPNGPEMATLLIAVSDCAACAPLNPALDTASCRHLIEQMRIDALVVADVDDSPAREVAMALGVPVGRVVFAPTEGAGTFELSLKTGRDPVAPNRPRPSDVSMLLHTSGTTARPKSVPYDSRNLVASAVARAARIQLTHADRALLLTPNFAASGIRRNLFPTLGAGGSVVCTPGFDASRFIEWLEEFQPTFYTGGPTVHRAAVDALARHGKPLQHKLRFVLSASAHLPADLQDAVERDFGVPLLQAYATTEAGSIAETPPPPAPGRRGSVGRAADSEIAIVDENGTPLPPGAPGEILVRSAEVFAGYENDPEANRAVFHDGWYRTGDLGYLDVDGFLFLAGRAKEIINRGGFKVSPVEIDMALSAHPSVVEAAAFAVPHSTLGEDVAVAVVLRDAASVTPQQLRDYALAELAAFKVPTRIVVVERLPKTPLGKVRRAALTEMHGQAPVRVFESPEGPHQMLVAQVFAEELGLPRVGADDNFFELGGDSLRGAQVVLRLNAAAGSNLPASTLFRRPTVAGFAAELAAQAGAGHAEGPPPITRRVRGGTVPSPDDATRG